MGTITAKTRKMSSTHQNPATSKKKRQRENRKKKQKLALLDYACDVLQALITDGFNTLPVYTYADYVRDIRTLHVRVNNEGLFFLTETLPNMAQDMFDHLEGRPSSLRKGGYGPFLKGALRYAYDGQLEYIRFIYQVSVAFKKIEGVYSKDKLVSQFAEFQQADEELRNIDWFEKDRFRLLERVRAYAAHFSKDFDPYGPDTVPRPGPGATNEHVPPAMRYTPRVVYQQLDQAYPYVEWFYHNPWAVNDQTREYLALRRAVEPTSRFKFVPKTARKARGICIEENEVQFLQQGLRRALTNAINRHDLYKKRIVLHDQSVNGFMALWGSETRGYATIDMTSASDLIARELVSWVFQDNQALHDCLMALSTRCIQPPPEVGGPLMRTAKFAPMGSAICFPVMSLLFMFIARAAVSLSDVQLPHLSSANIFVYGDDIVIPSHTYDVVVRAFQSLGLKINETKSFVRSFFRESCGVHAYQGVDITPVFVRKQPTSKRISSLRSLIETEHQYHSRGWYTTATVLRRYAKKTFPRYLRHTYFVAKDSDAVGFKRTSVSPFVHFNVPKETRWNSDLHRWEYKTYTFRSHVPKDVIGQDAQAILRWICLKPEPFSSRDVPNARFGGSDELVFNIARRWLPASTVYC